jgi:hypothetical protein
MVVWIAGKSIVPTSIERFLIRLFATGLFYGIKSPTCPIGFYYF